VEKMADDNSLMKWMGWILIIIALFATVGVLLYYVTLLQNPTGHLPPEIVLGAALVIGVIALVVSLTFMTVIFKSLNLTNPQNSLGLPEGSVRAVIALSLILIFMISSVFLYWQVGHGGIFTTSVNVTQAQIDKMPQGDIVSINRTGTYNNESIFNVTLFIDNPSSVDIAKQIITTVSTLVVAIAGFYFGTKAVSVAKGAVEGSYPLIRKIKPSGFNKGDKDKEFKICGKNFDTPTVKFIPSGIIECTNVKWNATEISCTLTIKEDATPGKYTLVVTNSDGGEDKLENEFQVTGAKPEEEKKPEEQEKKTP
jgi:hypothetical protein